MDKKLSIVIVSYNVRAFLEQAIRSIQKAAHSLAYEILIVDNASSDGTVPFVEKEFPSVKIIGNSDNVGFAKANNQAIRESSGEYICLINPDTIVQEDTFTTLLKFFENQSDAGCVGCKILNPDGSLQLACRRSYPTPWVAFTKIIGLAALFPKSKLFGRYNLTYLDPEQTSRVEAISGSFMLVRRRVIQEVGGLDESFFMYGEDLDWCYRINQAGHSIYYVPSTQIIHFKGESSKKSPFQQRRLFYEAMRLFVKRHFHKTSALLPSWLLIAAIYISSFFSYVSTFAQKCIWPGIDFVMYTVSLGIAVFIRFNPEFPWQPFILVHIVYSTIWLLSFSGLGLYSKNKLSIGKTVSAVILGWMINSALTFFFKQYGFSRAVVLWAGLLNLILMPGWRFLITFLTQRGFSWIPKSLKNSLLSRQTLVVGDKSSTRNLVNRLRTVVNGIYAVKGIVLTGKEFESEIDDIPVIGLIDQLPQIIERESVHEVIFTTERVPYDKMLKAMAASKNLQINFKMVPNNLDVVIGKATLDYIDKVPFIDLEYKLHSGLNPFAKRVFDIFIALTGMVVTTPLYLIQRFLLGKTAKEQSIYLNNNRKRDVLFYTNNIFLNLQLYKTILTGGLSMVGRDLFRPVTQSSIAQTIKPGLAGLEQIHKQKQLTAKDRTRYHLYYLRNYSPVLDIELLLKSMIHKN
ncbi:MAG: glycosyltransferase [candidate division KSB1 bacterium]|nr:glycosyltransferase [candidate division KSB1 bacterium]